MTYTGVHVFIPVLRPFSLFPVSLLLDLQWLDSVSLSTPLHERDQPLSASPQTGEKTLLNAISGLSRQLTWFAADVNEQFTVVNPWLLSIEDRLAALESKNCMEDTYSNPKIVVRICSVTSS